MLTIFFGLGVLSINVLWYSINHGVGCPVYSCLYLAEYEHRISAESALPVRCGTDLRHLFPHRAQAGIS